MNFFFSSPHTSPVGDRQWIFSSASFFAYFGRVNIKKLRENEKDGRKKIFLSFLNAASSFKDHLSMRM
jgi:hypothetical protein